ncbi:DegT/DnrJ/EryC1/StrS family aminotransferase, partial [Pseudomonadota bacterium]
SVVQQRDALLAATNDAELMTRPCWTLMHRLAPYRNCPKMKLHLAESLDQRLISLPSSPALEMKLAR